MAGTGTATRPDPAPGEPAGSRSERSERAERSELRRVDGQRVRVLVVDDESTLTELLSMALRLEGWAVQTAGSGFAALKAGRGFAPDAVVLDMMLPDMDGLEVLRRL